MGRTCSAVIVTLLTGAVGFAQPAPPPALTNMPPAGAMTTLTAPPPVTTIYEPGDGLTVSMLNGESKLKLFANFSALGVASTDRPFSAGLPLLLLPPSPFGLNTNTFDLHARQTNFGAMFTGPEVMGFTPGRSSSGSSRTTCSPPTVTGSFLTTLSAS